MVLVLRVLGFRVLGFRVPPGLSGLEGFGGVRVLSFCGGWVLMVLGVLFSSKVLGVWVVKGFGRLDFESLRLEEGWG